MIITENATDEKPGGKYDTDDGRYVKDGGGSADADKPAAVETGKDEEKSTPDSTPVELTGNELGEYKDIKELRAKAWNYFHDVIPSKITRIELGEIEVGKAGRDETISRSNETKLKLIPAIEQIIKTGKIGQEEDPHHPHKNGIVKFIPMFKTVKMSGSQYKMKILIGKTNKGKLYYNLFYDLLSRQKK